MKKKSIVVSICIMMCAMMLPSFVTSAEELEEQTIYLTDAEMEEILEEEISNLVNARLTAYVLNWTVPANTCYGTSYFRKAAGTSVMVDVDTSKTCKVGILDDDGVLRYVAGTSVTHTFSITKTNDYKVVVQNDNSSSATAKGYYYR